MPKLTNRHPTLPIKGIGNKSTIRTTTRYNTGLFLFMMLIQYGN